MEEAAIMLLLKGWIKLGGDGGAEGLWKEGRKRNVEGRTKQLRCGEKIIKSGLDHTYMGIYCHVYKRE